MATDSVTGTLESYGNNTYDKVQTTYSNISIRQDDGTLVVLDNVVVLQKFNPVFRLEDRLTINFFRPNKNIVFPYLFTNGRDTIDASDKLASERTRGLWINGIFLSLWGLIPLLTAMSGDEKQAMMLLLGLFTIGLLAFVPCARNFLTYLRYPKAADMKATTAAHAKDIEGPKEATAA